MSGTTRTFLALEIPPPLVSGLAEIQSRLDRQVSGVRWSPSRGFHLTLAFLGDLIDGDLDALGREVALASEPFAPVDLEIAGLGAFPDPRRPRVLWAGVGGPGLADLIGLQKAVASAAARAGHPPTDDRFHPHVTLGRIKPGRGRSPDASAAFARLEGWSAGSFSAGEVVVFASILTPTGPSYSRLSTAPLGGRKIGPSP